MKKIICYKIDDGSGETVIYDSFTSAMEAVKESLAIEDFDFDGNPIPVKIYKIEMTEKEFKGLPDSDWKMQFQ